MLGMAHPYDLNIPNKMIMEIANERARLPQGKGNGKTGDIQIKYLGHLIRAQGGLSHKGMHHR